MSGPVDYQGERVDYETAVQYAADDHLSRKAHPAEFCPYADGHAPDPAAMSADLFGASRHPKRLDPALSGYSDDDLTRELAGRRDVPAWLTDDDLRSELYQRERNRELGGGNA